MKDSKLNLTFDNYDIELSNDQVFKLHSPDSDFKYDIVYHDEEAHLFQCSQHSVKVFANKKLYRSAILCAVAGATTIHSHSAVIQGTDILICCADKVFSLLLPDLTLNWMKQMDMATCFGIYTSDNGLFIHGEMRIRRINSKGEIIWEAGLRDIIVNMDEDLEQEKTFEMQNNHISLLDFSGNKYQLGFDGNFIRTQLSERQKRWDLGDKKRKRKLNKSWWEFWI